MVNPFKIAAYLFGAEIVVFVPVAIVAGTRLRAISAKLTSYLKTARPEMD
jgi:hypothetical protein